MIVTNNPAVAIGDKVRIIKAEFAVNAWLEGAEFYAEQPSPQHGEYLYVPGQGYRSCEWEIINPEEPTNRYTMPPSQEVMATELAQLRIDLETALRDNRLLLDQRNALWSDFQKINDALLAEATDRGWCEDYEVFVKDLNESMTNFCLAMPEIEYEVTVQRTRFVYEQTTVTVSGHRGLSERDLRDAAFEEAWNSYDWDQTDDDVSDDYEVVDMREA